MMLKFGSDQNECRKGRIALKVEDICIFQTKCMQFSSLEKLGGKKNTVTKEKGR